MMTDVVMPPSRGLHLAEHLRAAAHLQVLFMSGYSDGVLGPRIPDGGPPLLEKPFDEASILSRVHDTIVAGPDGRWWERSERRGDSVAAGTA